MKKLAILGVTGSIGTSALDVLPGVSEYVKLTAIAAGKDWERTAEIAEKYGVQYAALADSEAASKLEDRLSGRCRVFSGGDSPVEMIRTAKPDVVLSGISGAAGLPASFETVRLGARLALANKETLVMAGGLLLSEAEKTDAQIIPVDSEHSAVFQCMKAGKKEEIDHIILTASGGPFRGRKRNELESVTIEEALDHPTWNMGRKITKDSATLMNKALEIVEAHHLFGLPPEKIRVVVHPQSIVHSMVVFRDGSTMAQMGPPDMRVPIQYALTHPDRAAMESVSIDYSGSGPLTFEDVDAAAFPAVDLAWEVCRRGGTSGTVMNAANEEAVAFFLEGKIKFTRITETVARAIEEHETEPADSLEAVLSADARTRTEVRKWLAS